METVPLVAQIGIARLPNVRFARQSRAFRYRGFCPLERTPKMQNSIPAVRPGFLAEVAELERSELVQNRPSSPVGFAMPV